MLVGFISSRFSDTEKRKMSLSDEQIKKVRFIIFIYTIFVLQIYKYITLLFIIYLNPLNFVKTGIYTYSILSSTGVRNLFSQENVTYHTHIAIEHASAMWSSRVFTRCDYR